MSYIRKQVSNGHTYLQRVEKYWDKETKRQKVRVLQNLGKEHPSKPPDDYAVIWSDAHTLGHIAIEQGNEVLAAIPQEAGKETTYLPCQLIDAGKFRNGKPRWWCRTHQVHFGKKADIKHCCNAHVAMNFAYNPLDLDIDKYLGGVGIWAALPPAICTRPEGASEPTGIHVHARKTAGGHKVIDKTFPCITLSFLESLGLSTMKMHVTPPSAVAWLDATERGVEMDVCRCTFCHVPHLDLGYFAQNPHKRHLCGNCGREFWAKTRNISNPLSLLSQALEKHPRSKVESSESLDIFSRDFPGGLEIYPSTPAILWTSPKPEQTGIHVHAWDAQGKRVIDETYGAVTLDGNALSREALLMPLLHQYTRPLANSPYTRHPKDA